jgi:cytochrome c oxidase subunit 4
MNRTPRNIFIALIGLLALTIAAAFVDFDRLLPGRQWGLRISLLIAITKALLIVLYFMRLKRDSWLTTAFATAGVLWLVIFAVLTTVEYTTRN